MPEPNDIPIELQTWLLVATLGQTEAARRRMREVYWGIYQENLARAEARGLAGAQAREAAVQALGDPWLVRNNPNIPTSEEGEEREMREAIDPELQPETEWNEDIFEPFKNWRQWRNMPEPTDLESWLAIATFKLSRASKARIGEEIAAHYQDALAERREAGLNEEAAAREVLAGLGSAREAWRRFRKSYPTEKDMRQLEGLRRAYRRPWVGFFKLVLGLILICFGYILFVVDLGAPVIHFIVMCQFIQYILIKPGARHIKSYYVFTPGLQGQEQRYNRMISIFYNIYLTFFLILISISPFFDPSIKNPYPHFIEMVLIILFMLAVLGLVVLHCNKRNLMMSWEKLRELAQSMDKRGPDQYA